MSHKTISGTILEHKHIKHFIGRVQPLLKPWHCQNWFNTPTFNFCTIVNLVTKVRKCDWHQSTNNVNWQISKNGSKIEVNGHLSEAPGQTWLPWGDNCTIELTVDNFDEDDYHEGDDDAMIIGDIASCCFANLPISSQSTSRLHSSSKTMMTNWWRWWQLKILQLKMRQIQEYSPKYRIFSTCFPGVVYLIANLPDGRSC